MRYSMSYHPGGWYCRNYFFPMPIKGLFSLGIGSLFTFPQRKCGIKARNPSGSDPGDDSTPSGDGCSDIPRGLRPLGISLHPSPSGVVSSPGSQRSGILAIGCNALQKEGSVGMRRVDSTWLKTLSMSRQTCLERLFQQVF